MRRYLLITRDFPPRPGGMATYYGGLASHFPEGTIAVLTVRRPGYVDIDVPVFRIGQGKGIERYYIWYRTMEEIYRKFPFDVVLCGNFSILSYPAFLFYRSFGVPYLLFFHGNDILTLWRKIKLNPAKRIIYSLTLKNAAGIIVNSRFTEKLVERVCRLKSRDILVLYPGVEDEFLRIEDKAKPFFKKKITILTVSRVVWRKGIHLVVKALGLLAADFLNICYEVVGMGDAAFLEFLEGLIKRIGVNSLVKLRGFVDRRELMEIYRNSDIFVMPSLYDEERCQVEGFGIAFLEANAFALPVLGSRTGGIPEAVLDGVTGVLVPGDFDEEDVAEALRWMITHREESIEMGKRGYERVNRDFSYSQRVRELTSFIESLCQKY
ncbi:MAG: hypothetical protein DRP95_07255 [Candidatus Latescibacterota bacterium]|mgnify:CR=1 FL=1|nr:MAG: hypothetical protein DRP95_07255 [Candidatus Latescibacterota bacterium]